MSYKIIVFFIMFLNPNLSEKIVISAFRGIKYVIENKKPIKKELKKVYKYGFYQSNNKKA